MLAAVLLATALVAPSTTPVTLLSGFLGAGKTTCLSHLLSNAEGLRLGVVVNDVAKLNIDAALVSNAAASGKSDSDVVKLQNGCACCSLSGELNAALRTLSASGDYDQLIVELSGVANPDTAKKNLQQALDADGALGVALDRVVTLVDSSTFLSFFERDVLVAQQSELRELTADDEDEVPIDKCADRKPVPQLLVNQVEGANVLVVNKLDLVSADEHALVEKLLRAFNPTAKLEATQFGAIPSDALVSATLVQAATQRAAAAASSTSSALGRTAEDEAVKQTELFTPAPPKQFKQMRPPKWSRPLDEPSPAAAASPVVDTLGIDSFVYSARRPFNAGRLFALLKQWPRDGASPLQRVSLELGPDATEAMAGEGSQIAVAEAERQLARNPDKPALRFTLDDRVECDMSSVDSEEATWAAGKVTQLWYAEPGMDAAPYQVLLDEGRYIFCPEDDDSVVRRATGDAALPPPHPFRGVLRSKGWCWINQTPALAGFWSHAGRSVVITQDGPWWQAAGDAEMRRQLGSGSRYDEAKSQFQGAYGDCRQDLVFIGVEPMDEAAIRRALDACLLTSKEEFAAFRQAWQAEVATREDASSSPSIDSLLRGLLGA